MTTAQAEAARAQRAGGEAGAAAPAFVPRPGAPVAVIGAGPAGLMAAEGLAAAGHAVTVFDAMPSAGRKFLMAGKGGMNLTHAEPLPLFLTRYGERQADLAPVVEAFGPASLRAWADGLGIETFVGTSSRVFPRDMKAAPLLRAWLARLRGQGVTFRMRHRWLGWDAAGRLRMATPDGEQAVAASAMVLALGGGSWARLGSDGAWVPVLAGLGADVRPLRPANCGFDVGWSPHFAERFAGHPLSGIAFDAAWAPPALRGRKGECIATAGGIEGSLVYAWSAVLRDRIAAAGEARIRVDLLPDVPLARVHEELVRPRGTRSLSTHLAGRLRLAGARRGLLFECAPRAAFEDPAALAAQIKGLALVLRAPRPLDEAISSAGGVAFESLDEGSMLACAPGVFCAGEMLDWEAPTGGYLLTACFASGLRAAQGAHRWLDGVAQRPA